MRAAVVVRPGGPEVIELRDVPQGPLAPGMARVQIERSSVNAADLWTRHPGIVSSYPHIPGSDGCGVLVELRGESTIETGSKVVINPALQLPTGERSWSDPYRDIVDILGYNCAGTCAEYCDVPIGNIFPAPSHLTIEESAAIPLTYLTAWRMLARRGMVERGEYVLIWGGSGGLGTAAIVLANYLGANVLATAGSDHDAEQVAGLKPKGIIRYDLGEVAKQVIDLIGRKVDLVFDSVAGPTWSATLQSLRPGGRVVLAGTTAGDVVTFDLSDFFYNQWALCGCRMGDERDFENMLKAVTEGHLKPVVGKVYPLSQISEAHQAMEDGGIVGKIVVNNFE
ncbi:zinc-binding dehydrogenase [Streptomyces kaniharaensis]|uniref:Zinc-binding dehydrogenase n=1 Tax=Streptomyces kaniharaensis TaxID=212423 RepID=A0A6N7KTK5_9ACTN|nr:zinc-binding dehydrogenase [Streptomyces kaniharaensis]MQS14771.1 zinc-binding dehydrogenase [Streptomyces kaniharaensis]